MVYDAEIVKKKYKVYEEVLWCYADRTFQSVKS